MFTPTKPLLMQQRGTSRVELIMFVVVTGVAGTGMRNTPVPISLSGMRQ